MSTIDRIARVHRPGHRLSVAAPWRAALVAAGFDDPRRFAALLEGAPPIEGGRGGQRRIVVPGALGALRIRSARHGGLLGRALADRHVSPARIENELALWLALHDRGLALPTPVAAIARRRRGFWRCHLATREREHARDGFAWLASRPSPIRLRRAAVDFARSLRALHDAGVVHGDLHPGNVLVEEDGETVRCLFIDLDRARRHASVSTRRRLAELARCARALEKHGLAETIDRRLRARVIAAYCGPDRDLRRAMEQGLRRERWRLAGHRLAWRAGRVLARRPPLPPAAGIASAILPGAAGFVLALTTLVALLAASSDRPGDDASAPRWSLLAVGDTGQSGPKPALFEGQLAVSAAMTQEARRVPVDAMALLGDNFYDVGLIASEMPDRLRTNVVRPYCHFLALDGPRSAEIEAACPLPATTRRPVPILAVLGNHDLESAESAPLQRHVVPDFLPGWTMSEQLARVVEVAPGVSVVLFESEIAIDDRPALRAALVDALERTRGPWRIVLTHRPVATDELGHPPVGGYPMWMRKSIAETGLAVQLVVSGHHHDLEAYAVESPTPLLQIGVGSGSRARSKPVPPHPELRFAALELGFARIDLVGQAPDDRLAVSLYSVPPWPWLARLRGYRLRARFEVDRSGRVEGGPIAGASSSDPAVDATGPAGAPTGAGDVGGAADASAPAA